MIKLKDLLPESVNEAIDEVPGTNLQDVINVCQQLAKYQVMWRGMSSKSRTGISLVTNDRAGDFRGGNDGAKLMLKTVGVKNPIFVVSYPMGHAIFGKQGIVVPKIPFDIYQSDTVSDVMSYNRNEFYFTNTSHGGTSRQSATIGKYKFDDPNKFHDALDFFQKTTMNGKNVETIKTEAEIRKIVLEYPDDEEWEPIMYVDPVNYTIVTAPSARSFDKSEEFGNSIGISSWYEFGDEEVISRNPSEMNQRAMQGAKTYSKIHNMLPLPGREVDEMILDTSEYWQVEIQTVLSRGGRYMPFHESEYNKISTYSELANVLSKFQSYYQFIAKRNAERDQ